MKVCKNRIKNFKLFGKFCRKQTSFWKITKNQSFIAKILKKFSEACDEKKIFAFWGVHANYCSSKKLIVKNIIKDVLQKDHKILTSTQRTSNQHCTQEKNGLNSEKWIPGNFWRTYRFLHQKSIISVFLGLSQRWSSEQLFPGTLLISCFIERNWVRNTNHFWNMRKTSRWEYSICSSFYLQLIKWPCNYNFSRWYSRDKLTELIQKLNNVPQVFFYELDESYRIETKQFFR